MGDTCGAGAQAEIEGVFSSKSPIETSNGTTWVPAKEGKKKALYNASKVRSFHAAAGADTSIV